MSLRLALMIVYFLVLNSKRCNRELRFSTVLSEGRAGILARVENLLVTTLYDTNFYAIIGLPDLCSTNWTIMSTGKMGVQIPL